MFFYEEYRNKPRYTLRLYMSHTRQRSNLTDIFGLGGIWERQKSQAPTPQAPVRNRQTSKVANAKVRIG